jgi:hypothetical protein
MCEPTFSKEESEQIINDILDQEKLDNVVFATTDALMCSSIEDMINQPVEGLLYDLNRDKATCISNLREGGITWINNYAVALVIIRLKEKLEKYERNSENVRRL